MGDDEDTTVWRYIPECPMQDGWNSDPNIPKCSGASWRRCGKCISYVSEEDCRAQIHRHCYIGIHKAPARDAELASKLAIVHREEVDPEELSEQILQSSR